jgi:hypothetical protein
MQVSQGCQCTRFLDADRLGHVAGNLGVDLHALTWSQLFAFVDTVRAAGTSVRSTARVCAARYWATNRR